MQKPINWPAVIVAALGVLSAFLATRYGLPAPLAVLPDGYELDRRNPAVPPPPSPAKDPRDAIGKLVMAGGYCSATVVTPPQADGSATVLSAAHCIKAAGEECRLVMRDGRSCKASVIAIDRKADVALLRSEPLAVPLPYVTVATETPPVGSDVFHAGYGNDKPANTERGKITERETPSGQVVYLLSVSHGDSGGGICLDSGGKVLSPVCCTTNVGATGSVYGGRPERIQEMMRSPTSFIDLPPVAMPPAPAGR